MKSGRYLRSFAPLCLALVAAAVRAEDLPAPPAAAAGTPALPVGPVDLCQRRSPFIQAMKLPDNARLSTATPGIVGFNILTLDTKTRRIRPLLHPTWKSAGELGQFTQDGAGNIYVVPVPLTSLDLNPPEARNRVQIIDGQTGRMRVFVDLPGAGPADPANPFGVIGLAYDCETDSLYVASLAGSTPSEERGSVFRVDVKTATVAARYDGIDALGVGIFRGQDGKRLYLGSARRSEVVSLALDGRGDFVGETRRELALGDLGLPSTYRAQKLRFDRQARMSLKAVPFAFSLRIISPKEIRHLALSYLPGGTWEAAPGAAETDMGTDLPTEMSLD